MERDAVSAARLSHNSLQRNNMLDTKVALRCAQLGVVRMRLVLL